MISNLDADVRCTVATMERRSESMQKQIRISDIGARIEICLCYFFFILSVMIM